MRVRVRVIDVVNGVHFPRADFVQPPSASFVAIMDSEDDDDHYDMLQQARQEVRLLRLMFESRGYFISQSFRDVRFTANVFR